MRQRIVDYHATDRRILAIGLFGSLARGNWDEWSDLDLDDDDMGNGKTRLTTAHRRLIQEIHLVCASIDKRQLLANTRKGQSA